MATPITHIALADSVFDTYFEGKSKRKFFVGLLFPDIRYLQVIARDQIHFSHVHIQQIISEDSFLAGAKFHSLIEQIREEFMRAHSVYYSFPRNDITVHAMHFLEDELLYDVVSDWREYRDLYTTVLPDELHWKVADSDINRWHQSVRQYLAVKPDDRIRREYLEWLGCNREEAHEVNQTVAEMRSNPDIVQMINQLYHSFKYLLLKA
jgi:PAS domain-containing protein